MTLDVTRIRQQERLAELAEYGIKAEPGRGVAGSIQLYATQVVVLLKVLKKLKKSAGKGEDNG